MNDNNKFISMLSNLNLSLTDNQLEQFNVYYNMLIEKNKVMNLTAITEYEEVVSKHFVDSLSIVKIIDLNKKCKILDMGTGAGFPGIPLKIAFPECEVVLLDSLNKRVTFLNDVINKLNLKNIKAIHGRAEDFGKDSTYREKFDLCVSRAVAKLATLSEYCIPYIKLNGSFISYKAGNVENELNEAKKAIQILGGNINKDITFLLPESDIERTLIEIKKIKSTPKEYPRLAGKPVKEPLH